MRSVPAARLLAVSTPLLGSDAAVGSGSSQDARAGDPTCSWAACRPARRRAEPLALSILDAINRALEHNLGVLTAEEGVGRARGTRWNALSATAAERERARLRDAAEGQPGGVRLPAAAGHSRRSSGPSTCSTPASTCRSRSSTCRRSTTRAPRRTTSRRREYSVQERARSRGAGRGERRISRRSPPRARAESARRAGADRRGALHQALDLKQSGLVAGIDVLRAEVQLEHRAAARDGGAQRLREGQAAAGARHRPAARPGFTLERRAPVRARART